MPFKSIKSICNIYLALVAISLLPITLLGQGSQIYSTPGTYTWTVPPCVYEITVEVYGGGGGGGAVWSRFSVTANGADCESGDEICAGAGGGGGGGYARRTYAVTPGQTYTVVVGAGGQGGVINNGVSYSSAAIGPAQNGSVGGNSTFSGPATAGPGTLTAFGGNGGQCANIQRSCLGGCSFNHNGEFGVGGTGGGGQNGTTMFTGGNGAAGSHSASTNDKSGGGGGGAGSTANGGNASTTTGGSGGPTGGGNGANGIVQPYGSGYLGTNGANGSVMGGGGSGASSHHETSCSSTAAQSRVGGNGARGEVRITYTTPATNTPTFTQVAPICTGETLSPLPTVSLEGISGAWSPSLNNSATTTYTFTPDPDECAATATMTITVNPPTNVPVFTQVSPICSGDVLASLPLTSTNGISGTWSPSINNTVTTAYTFTPSPGQCAAQANMTITVNQPVTPIFTQVGPVCIGSVIDPLPGTSTNGISGQWSPSINNTATTTYTFAPVAGQCATGTSMTISVGAPITPSFAPIAPVCSGTAVDPLPSASLEGISGTWSPAFNNQSTTNYIFTPAPGECAQATTVSVEVNSTITPLFDPVPAICSGETLDPLPATSTNGIAGSWSPGLNNLATTIYTFTPNTNQCAVTSDLTITVNSPSAVPVFPPVDELCLGVVPPVLNTVSDNGITGTWSQPVSTAIAGTQTYTFTPDPGECGVPTTLDITVVSPVTPLFNSLAGVCQNANAPVLDQVSLNGIDGVWSPAVSTDVSGTQTYTFAPLVGECAVSTTLDLVVYPTPSVNAGQDLEVCEGAQVTVSAQGANAYSWTNNVTDGTSFTPAIGVMVYTVTGTSVEGCTATDQLTVTVHPNPVVSAGADQTLCEGTSVVLSGSGATTYSWDNGVVNNIQFQPPSGSTVYSVTGTDANGCIDADQVTVSVIEVPAPSFQFSGVGCVPLSVTLTNTTPNAEDCEWSVSNGDELTGCNSVTTTLSQPGCYDVTLTTMSNGCSATFTAYDIICAEAAPDADFSFSPGTVSTLEPEVQFENLSIGATSYSWDFGDDSALSDETDPVHVFPDDASSNYEVMLVAYSQTGCTDTAYAFVSVEEELIFWVPNTFTPDGDIYNQTFEPVFSSGFDPYNYHLTIFNRWGQIVFESYNHEIGWDGSYGGVDGSEVFHCQDGTYTWKIDYKVKNNDERKVAVGHVNLIR